MGDEKNEKTWGDSQSFSIHSWMSDGADQMRETEEEFCVCGGVNWELYFGLTKCEMSSKVAK